MKSCTYRTTFALDEATARRLNHMSSFWHVSKAEVVRRAIAMAEEGVSHKVNAGELLRKAHAAGGGLVREDAETYLADVRAARADWRSRS